MLYVRRLGMKTRYDLAIIGSGFAGSLTAMIACRLGLSVLLLERGRHPRMAIGESSTPLSNLLLEELADTYDLPQLRPLTKWGSWQQSYPQVACGLKRGFSFFYHALGKDLQPEMCDRQLIVAASPNDHIADTHWYRADFDHLLVQQAQELGVEYIDSIKLDQPIREPDGWTLTGTRNSHALTWRVGFLIDATGPRGFLSQALQLGEKALPAFPRTSALYAHFSAVAEFSTAAGTPTADAPYPVDAAALHHVFEGGWIWILRFNNGITSAGVAATNRVANRLNFASGEAAWSGLLDTLPEVKAQFRAARSVTPFTVIPQLAFRSARVTGPGWALLSSAAGFVDPLLSTGFPLTLLGISRMAALLARDWNTSRFEQGLQQYARQTDDELLATGRLIAALYRSMGDFPTFRAVSLLYFAAASYAETARRLGRPELAGGFLLHDHPVFGLASEQILSSAGQRLSPADKLDLQRKIYGLVAPFDVAGLSARPRSHCYPVRADDLFQSAHKLGATRQEIEKLLERTGFYAAAH